MRTDNPALQVEQPDTPEAYRNSTMAERKAKAAGKPYEGLSSPAEAFHNSTLAERKADREAKTKGTKQVKGGENKAVKSSDNK